MFFNLISICIISASATYSFSSQYDKEVAQTVEFLDGDEIINATLSTYLNIDDVICAKSIVAPEVAMCFGLKAMIEYQTMGIVYVNTGSLDFSIGVFQMKPSFAERIEYIVNEIDDLKIKYESLLMDEPNLRLQRKKRFKRLISLDWQVCYLAAFIDIVKVLTDNYDFKTSEEKVKYWATLYNAGIDLSSEQVYEFYKTNEFPRNSRLFNYSNVALEFYALFRRNHN